MKSKRKPSQAGVQQNHLGRALNTFEEALELLDRHQPSGPLSENLPALPLPSLLARCQAIAGAKKHSPKLLVCFPGVPQLDPAWWQGRVRSTVFRRFPEIMEQMDPAGRQAMVDVMQSELDRRGCNLVLLATPDEIFLEEHASENLFVLACHPWTSFACGRPYTAETLEDFCASLQEFLADHPSHTRLRLEDLGHNATAQGIKLADALDLQSVEADPDPEFTEQIWKDQFSGIEKTGGGAVYNALCVSLGYDQVSYSFPNRGQLDSHQTLGRLPLSKEGALARVSQFLPRLRILDKKAEPARVAALVSKLDDCLEEKDFTDQFDKIVSVSSDENTALLMILAGAHFSTHKEGRLQALNMLTGALELISENEQELRALVTSLYLDLNEPALALKAMTQVLEQPGMLSAAGEKALHATIEAHRKAGSNDHGHALLIEWLNDNPPLQIGRKRLMVEIGTTRENVPGQGSTRKLGLLCAKLGMDFVTVDMDPGNSQRARSMFRRLGLPFQAITAKGEDYLAQHEGPIDYVFLDAYDFDHGQHSEVRQIRYERHLGSRINNEACHQMHLECAQSLLTRLSKDGVICFDDTWTDDNGEWTAKGATAMPFLLNNGFKVVEASNRAALLTIKS